MPVDPDQADGAGCAVGVQPLPDPTFAPHLYQTIREWDVEEAGELRAAFQRAAEQGNEQAAEVLRLLANDDPFWARRLG